MSRKFSVFGRPIVEVAPVSGLRTIRRRYRATGKFTSLRDVPSEWILAWGTPDEDLPAAVLDEQILQGDESNPDADTSILMRVYREATSTPQDIAAPELGMDENGRRTVRRSLRVLSSVAESVKSGEAGSVYPDRPSHVLAGSQWTEGHAVSTLTWSYAEASDELIQVGGDKIDYELNGLARITRTFIGTPEASVDSFVVGQTSTGGSQPKYLAQLGVEESEAVKRVSATYLQPGVLSKSRSGGPNTLSGTLQHSWNTWMVDPRDAQAMTDAGAGDPIPGVVTSIQDQNVFGFVVRTYSSLSDSEGESPLGVLTEYFTSRRVTRHGVVSVQSKVFVGGQIPYLETSPPTQGEVRAKIVVKLEEDPPVDVVPDAFNLDSLSVGAAVVSRASRYVGQATTESGSVTVTAYAEKADVRHQNMRGYVFANTEHNGVEKSFSYDSGVYRSSGGSIVGTIQSTEYMTITLTGSSAPTEPGVGALIAVDTQPINLSADGGVLFRNTYIYYEPDDD